jgi:hypothetical protein
MAESYRVHKPTRVSTEPYTMSGTDRRNSKA